jgi:hypothetical protein
MAEETLTLPLADCAAGTMHARTTAGRGNLPEAT